MAELDPVEVQRTIEGVLASRDAAYTWVTGEVELVTRSGVRIRGTVKSLDPDSVLLSTGAGDDRCDLDEIVNVLVEMSSPGPE